ncbi:MAG TPA: RNA polymerase subunit sigma [Microscillaceae bacterium]|nr:RNA polymerase subunit sigma [Microscillaceae bacterium]
MKDEEILALFAQESTKQRAFQLLVNKYQEKVYGMVRKMLIDHDDSDDLTQDIFIKVWKNLDNFRAESGLFTWIYRITTNECLNFLKKKRRKFFLPIHNVQKELTQKLSESSLISADEIQLKFQQALLIWPDKQRLVFNMRYFEDLSYEEISNVLGTSVGALKASYHLAAKKIEEFLQKN